MGVLGLTAMRNCAVVEPTSLVAVIVYSVRSSTCSGLPLILPSLDSCRPDGSAGVAVNLMGGVATSEATMRVDRN